MYAITRICCLVLVASCVGCPAPPAEPALDQELERYRSLKNESIDLACVCPMNVIGSDGEVLETEAECLADLPRVKPSGLECMKDALAAVYGDEAEGAALIACYNDALANRAECLEGYDETCDLSAKNQCFSSFDLSDCDNALTQQQSETILLCAFE